MPCLDRFDLQRGLLNPSFSQFSMMPFGSAGANMVHPEGNGQCRNDRPCGRASGHCTGGHREGDDRHDGIVLSFQGFERSGGRGIPISELSNVRTCQRIF
jgi:hypothetical protein